MINLSTVVALPPSPPRLAYGQVGLTFGSCFSDYIATYLQDGGMRTLRSPFGTMYNPLSIAEGIRRLLAGRALRAEDLVQRDGLYHSFMHHGSYSHREAQVMLEQANQALEEGSKALGEADHLFLTWGTAFVYRLADPSLGGVGQVVSNCHKFPAKIFTRSRLSLEEMLSEWLPLLDELFRLRPELHIIQTVSPIRHLQDGAHGNALSKATLLLFAEALAEKYPGRISYFPAYEILLDELRDYRYYADDLKHPSKLAVRLILERFEAWAMEEKTAAGIREAKALFLESLHAPLHKKTEEHRERIARLEKKIEDFRRRYPLVEIDFPRLWID